MTSNFVSIIITTYNVENYIERTVQSALAQQDADIEVIIVDDCSTDKTWQIISSIKDSRVKAIQQATNSGPSAARNTAIAAATGTWIAVLDGDDTYAPDRIVKCLKRAAVVNADIVVDNLTIRREADGATYKMFNDEYFAGFHVLTLADFIRGNTSFMGGISLGYLKPIFSASFLKEHALSYDPDIRIGEDYLLLAMALASGAVCAVEQSAGYYYTVRANSISHRLAPKDMERIAACDHKFLSRYSLDEAAAKAQKLRAFRTREAYAFTRLVEALKNGNVGAAVKAILYAPTSLRYLWLPIRVRLQKLFAGRG